MNNRYIDKCVFDTDGKEYDPANMQLKPDIVRVGMENAAWQKAEAEQQNPRPSALRRPLFGILIILASAIAAVELIKWLVL